jgi:probable phosphoglycerate mutase
MDSFPARLWLVRHGHTQWLEEGRFAGWRDIELSEAGRAQARALAAVLAGVECEKVLRSPLKRARETCELAGWLDRAAVVDDLKERNYGILEGRTLNEIRAAQPGWSIWSDATPEGETTAQVAERARRVLASLRGVRGPVLLFGHGNHLRTLTALWMGLQPQAGGQLSLGPATISILARENGCGRLDLWNWRPSLDAHTARPGVEL